MEEKTIKIQGNNNISPSYNRNSIEGVYCGNMEQTVNYLVLDEYTLPLGTYVELRNFDNILFDEATKITNNKRYKILQSDEVPTCEMMTKLYNENIDLTSTEYKGIAVISTSESVYNKINISFEEISENCFRITDINLEKEYKTLSEAKADNGDKQTVVLNFNELYSQCAKYWKAITENSLTEKTSAFNTSLDQTIIDKLESFQKTENNTSEYWNTFSNNGEIHFVFPGGKKYLLYNEGTEQNKIETFNYNIFDVIFKYIYPYLYKNNSDNVEVQPTVKNPKEYTFLLKTYKIYSKVSAANSISISNANISTNSSSEITVTIDENLNNIPIDFSNIEDSLLVNIASNILSYNTKILTIDEIKELSAYKAQEYFNTTIVHNNANYQDKLILSETEAKEILISKNITECGKYFIISENIGVKCPSNTQMEYYDLGNFELLSKNKNDYNIYKYNKNGKVIKVREIYDPLSMEYHIISQNHSGTFDENYKITRFGVCIRCSSGKSDYYYFSNSESAIQFKEDLLYAMEDGPNIINVKNLTDIIF